MRRIGTELCTVITAAALTLGIALTGCSSQSQSQDTQESAEEQQATEETGAQEIEIPEEMSTTVAITKDLASGGEVASESDFESLEKVENEQLDDIVSDDDVKEGLDSADKAPSGVVLLETGGFQIQVPVTWFVAQNDNGFVLVEPNGAVTGYMYSVPKEKGVTYDVEAMAKSVPTYYWQQGLVNVQIIDHGTGYSATGAMCASYVLFSGTHNGNTGIYFSEFLESKSYINCLEFFGSVDGFAAASNDIGAMADSMSFGPGEAI